MYLLKISNMAAEMQNGHQLNKLKGLILKD